MANRALEHAAEPDLLVDLHWTLAQCRMRAGLSAESLATLDRALAAPGISARHRARLLVLAARTHDNLGEHEKAEQVAADALAAASEAGDNWAMGWALHVLTLVTAAQGHMTERAAAVRPGAGRDRVRSGADRPAAAAADQQGRHIGLPRPVRAGPSPRPGRHGTSPTRLARRCGAHAHGALGQLLFQTGRWDEALAEVQILPENLKEPGAACGDLGIAAVVCFHRGETGAARHHLAAAVPHAKRLGHRLISSMALARSLDHEHDGALSEALAALTDAFDGHTEDVDEIEDLLTDAVRLAAETGDLSTARALADRAEGLAAGSEIPHRRANALYCRGLLDHDGARLLTAAERYGEASLPLPRAKALEAAAGYFVDADDRGQARTAFTTAVEVYHALGAAADVSRLHAAFRAHGIWR